jgi:glycosyltransferase involved in cell wall biosynthesis
VAAEISVRVGVIAGEMERHSTGVGRYLSGLLGGLTRWDHGIDWTLFFQGEPFDHPVFQEGAFELRFSRFPGHPVVWEQWVLPRQLRGLELDLLFAPAYAVPFGVRVPTVVTIYDLSFERFPADFGRRELWRRRLLARRAARVARRVLTASGHIADELRGTYGVDSRRLGIVPIGIGRDVRATDPALRPESMGVRRPFLLVAGTVLDRRFPRLTLEVFADIARERPELQLVFAGANRMRRPQRLDAWVDQEGLGDRVRLLGWIEDEQLATLYGAAELTLYLSAYEGFGIPPLESLACATPVVVGPGLALDEIWPDYPFRVNEVERGQVSAMVRRILERPAEVADVVRSAEPVLARLDWETCSRRLVRELERALEP